MYGQETRRLADRVSQARANWLPQTSSSLLRTRHIQTSQSAWGRGRPIPSLAASVTCNRRRRNWQADPESYESWSILASNVGGLSLPKSISCQNGSAMLYVRLGTIWDDPRHQLYTPPGGLYRWPVLTDYHNSRASSPMSLPESGRCTAARNRITRAVGCHVTGDHAVMWRADPFMKQSAREKTLT